MNIGTPSRPAPLCAVQPWPEARDAAAIADLVLGIDREAAAPEH